MSLLEGSPNVPKALANQTWVCHAVCSLFTSIVEICRCWLIQTQCCCTIWESNGPSQHGASWHSYANVKTFSGVFGRSGRRIYIFFSIWMLYILKKQTNKSNNSHDFTYSFSSDKKLNQHPTHLFYLTNEFRSLNLNNGMHLP